MGIEGKADPRRVSWGARRANSFQTNSVFPISSRGPVPSSRPAPPVPALVLWDEQEWVRESSTHYRGGGCNHQAARGHQRGPQLGPSSQPQCPAHDDCGCVPLGLLCIKPSMLDTMSCNQGMSEPHKKGGRGACSGSRERKRARVQQEGTGSLPLYLGSSPFDWLSLPTRWWTIGHRSLPMQK